ncbi:caspase family protein [Litorisediminicola beolgyonensis]|uniref:Caspase family protein n=1 Tax=Litorisediminicola beolgyonensis TaxID=1173614 RepID=A0ABW3ZKM2_9RHOB
MAAQDDQGKLRTLVRNPNARGLPALEIDLEQASTQRYALVIGNADYTHAEDLPNAAADAALVADLLRKAGFTVAEHRDLTKQGFEAALRQALYEVEFGAEFAFYYAGHGVQIGDGNYLIPTDMAPGSVHDVPMNTVSLSSVMGMLSARTRSVMVVLDSCRNNPFPDQSALVSLEDTPRPLQTGFAALDTPINSLVLFSTSPGAVALDGTGANSPFTRAFVDLAAASPDRPIDELMKDIRRRVYLETDKLQVPWSSSSLVEPIVLGAAANAQSEPAPPTGAAPPLSLAERLDRRVAIGARLTAPEPGAGFALRAPPRSGRLELAGPKGFEALPRDIRIPSDRVKDIVYSTQFDGDTQPGTTEIAQLSDRFELQLGATTRPVEVALEVDACDRQAGDHLDPESVGFARYPNEIEPAAALAACEAAVARDPGVGRFHYQLGRAHLALKNLDAAQAAFQEAADLGHSRAYHGLGTVEVARALEQGGQSREAAPQLALAYFLKGVQRGDPYAYHSLGLQLLKFPQTDADRRNGFDLLSRSLELGHTFSMNALGLYFLEENSDRYDPARGLRYLRESAARGDIYGYANLGFVALTGAGGQPVDYAKAEELFRKAALQGHPAAASSLGRMYVNGQIGGRRDDARAIEWYDRGLAQGDAWGGANAAWVIANRKPAGYTPFDAATRAAKAATMRNAEAASEARKVLTRLGKSALDGGAQQLMRDLGADVSVDGAFGPGSRAALDQIADRFERQFPESPQERLLKLARLYWENTKFRVDLY